MIFPPHLLRQMMPEPGYQMQNWVAGALGGCTIRAPALRPPTESIFWLSLLPPGVLPNNQSTADSDTNLEWVENLADLPAAWWVGTQTNNQNINQPREWWGLYLNIPGVPYTVLPNGGPPTSCQQVERIRDLFTWLLHGPPPQLVPPQPPFNVPNGLLSLAGGFLNGMQLLTGTLQPHVLRILDGIRYIAWDGDLFSSWLSCNSDCFDALAANQSQVLDFIDSPSLNPLQNAQICPSDWVAPAAGAGDVGAPLPPGRYPSAVAGATPCWDRLLRTPAGCQTPFPPFIPPGPGAAAAPFVTCTPTFPVKPVDWCASSMSSKQWINVSPGLNSTIMASLIKASDAESVDHASPVAWAQLSAGLGSLGMAAALRDRVRADSFWLEGSWWWSASRNTLTSLTATPPTWPIQRLPPVVPALQTLPIPRPVWRLTSTFWSIPDPFLQAFLLLLAVLRSAGSGLMDALVLWDLMGLPSVSPNLAVNLGIGGTMPFTWLRLAAFEIATGQITNPIFWVNGCGTGTVSVINIVPGGAQFDDVTPLLSGSYATPMLCPMPPWPSPPANPFPPSP